MGLGSALSPEPDASESMPIGVEKGAAVGAADLGGRERIETGGEEGAEVVGTAAPETQGGKEIRGFE